MEEKILVTGTAGFIGFHLAVKLLERGDIIIGLDNISDYYDPELKFARLTETGINREKILENKAVKSEKYHNYSFFKIDLTEKEQINELFKTNKITKVVHMAAQAGVRYSLTNPYAYLDSNLYGFLNILEACRYNNVTHLVYASSSSVYGLNKTMPFSVHHNVDHPISLYAATKKSNELMAHTYSYLYGLPVTGLRFFTVYGPWGRPDMALFLFTEAIIQGKPMDVFNQGEMQRDFTYIDDIVEGVIRVLDNPPEGEPVWDGDNPDPATSPAPFKLYNIGNSSPVKLMDFIKAIEKKLGKTAIMNLQPLQPGDVPKTWADVNDLETDLNYKPATEISTGVNKFIEWYLQYFAGNKK